MQLKDGLGGKRHPKQHPQGPPTSSFLPLTILCLPEGTKSTAATGRSLPGVSPLFSFLDAFFLIGNNSVQCGNLEALGVKAFLFDCFFHWKQGSVFSLDTPEGWLSTQLKAK